MKIQILSDIHNEFSVLPHPHTDADVVILAGDVDIKDQAFDWAVGFNKPVLYVLGNHEFYGQDMEEVKSLWRVRTQGTSIALLDNDKVTLGDVRFIGGTLWTDFKLYGNSNEPIAVLEAKLRMNDFKHIRLNERRFMPEDSIDLHHETLNYITQALEKPFECKTVVITHHAPSPKSIASEYENDKLSPSFASDLEHLMGEPVTLWIHGHVHHSNNYEVNGTRVVSNPRGYQFKNDYRAENLNFNPSLVLNI